MIEWIDSLHWSLAILFFWVVGIVRTSLVFALGWSAASGSERWSRIHQLMQGPLYQRAQKLIHTWGALAVPLCFITVGFQTAVILATGFMRMPLLRWIPAMLLGTFIWGLIYGTIGMAVFWAWLQGPALALGAILLVALLLWGLHRRQKQ